MIVTATNNGLTDAALDNASGIFSQDSTELEWLAYFVTANETAATACVIDACGPAEEDQHGRHWPMERDRQATLQSAIEMQRNRIAQLSATYEHRICMHSVHRSLSPELIDLIVQEDGCLVRKLDVLCRCALVICGLEQRPFHQAATLLGVSEAVVTVAYCRALEYLEGTVATNFIHQNEFAAVCN